MLAKLNEFDTLPFLQAKSVLTVVPTSLVRTTVTRCNGSQIPVVWYNSNLKKGGQITLT